MGFGAALSGGAQGVMQSWDDNRADIKAQAARDFQVELENTRRANAKTDRDQSATDIMNPDTPTGMLAARNTKAAADSKAAEWAHDERMAGIKANKGGKGKNSESIDALTKEIDASLELMMSDSVEGGVKKSAQARYGKAITELRALTGLSPDAKPSPTPGALAKLKRGQGTAADFAGFNKAFGLPEGSAQKLYSEGRVVEAVPPPAKERAPSLYEQRAGKKKDGQKPQGTLTSYLKSRQADPIQTAKDTIDDIAARQGNGESIRDFLPYLQRYIEDETLPKEVREAARQIFMQ